MISHKTPVPTHTHCLSHYQPHFSEWYICLSRMNLRNFTLKKPESIEMVWIVVKNVVKGVVLKPSQIEITALILCDLDRLLNSLCLGVSSVKWE